MIDIMALGATTPLPSPPLGWFEYGYTVLWNGDLGLVRIDRDIYADWRLWLDKVQAGDRNSPRPNLRGAQLRISRFDGNIENGAIEVSASAWPIVGGLSDGRWLVASTRAAPDEDNARLFAPDGTPDGAFCLGDGIEHICCAADGTIWVGYFDEGVFSLPNKDGIWPVSSSGVARFGPDGRLLWMFNDESRPVSIADCYALAPDGGTVWCCPYTDFPIVRVEGGVVRHWSNDIAGARAIAVDGDYVLLAGGYDDRSDRLALLRLDHDLAQEIGEWRFKSPEKNTAKLIQGWGATLHIVGRGQWTKLSLTAIREALKL